jgi:hypothetical protein
MISYPILDHAQIENAHERLVASRQWAVQKQVQLVRIKQPPRVEVAI